MRLLGLSRLWMRLMQLPVLLVLAGCTFNVKESNVVISRSAPPVEIAVLQQAWPGYRVEQTGMQMADGTELSSLRLVRQDAIATVLYFGGNGYTIARHGQRTVGTYRELPVNLVLVDHRGYGGSGGSASLSALMSDAIEVYDAVRVDPVLGTLPVVVHGHSLGSFMAGGVADARSLDGLVLESSVTTAEAWTAHLRAKQSWWIRALVWKVKPDASLAGLGNAGVAGALDEPVLFVVGAEDDVTPARFSRELYAAAPLPEGDRRLVVVPGRGHMDAAESPEFRAAAGDLLARVGRRTSVAEAPQQTRSPRSPFVEPEAAAGDDVRRRRANYNDAPTRR